MTNTIRTLLTDKLSGKNTVEFYKLYSETQWYSHQQIIDFQLKKLRLLLNHCYLNVPFYRNIIENEKIDLNRIDDLDVLSVFPIITKQTILNNYNDFIPDNIEELPGVKTSQTGGTTGQILFKRTDANLRSSAWGANKRFFDWMEIGESDVKLKLMGGHISKPSLKNKLKERINDKLFNEFSFDPYDNSESNFKQIRQVLRKKPICLIRGYSQHLFTLAKQFEERNDNFNVKAIMTTAEPLMPEHRMLFKKVFNAESFDQYGSGEIGAIAFECASHEGLHITDERVVVETDADNNLIFTDLDNFAMPYIRYRNDDQAIISDKPCSCGRKSKLIKQVLGRTCDYIIGINGKTLHWAYFWHLMFDTEIAYKRNIIKFQIHQANAETIHFRTVGGKLTDEDQAVIRNYMFDKLGKMSIEFINEPDIENAKSGKYRPVVNDLLLKQ